MVHSHAAGGFGMGTFTCRLTVGVLIVCLVASARGALCRSLGDLPGGPFYSNAEAISGDGKVIAGQSQDTQNSAPAVRFTDSGPVMLQAGATGSGVGSISYDGSVIVGFDESNGLTRAFRWINGTYNLLPP